MLQRDVRQPSLRSDLDHDHHHDDLHDHRLYPDWQAVFDRLAVLQRGVHQQSLLMIAAMAPADSPSLVPSPERILFNVATTDGLADSNRTLPSPVAMSCSKTPYM
jgi:hypothetical protein